ncbi:MAG: glycosyltransferase family 4 protein [bacterium]|nr:glycosyltransferase family 4 protein [bacterium]
MQLKEKGFTVAKKKVAIITYFYPPSSGPAVQRISKLIKYLDKERYEVTVYTSVFQKKEDYSIFEDVLNVKKVFYIKHLNILKGPYKNKFIHKAACFFRLFFVPEVQIFFALKCRKAVLKGDEYDVIFTTGGPHSNHLVGLYVKKRKPDIKWIVDFRDPWVEFSYRKKVPGLNLIHSYLEKKVIDNADVRIAVTSTYASRFEERYNKKFHLIYNGYDPEEFKEFKSFSRENKNKLIFLHAGTMLRQRSWGLPYLEKILAAASIDYEIHFYGFTDDRYLSKYKHMNIKNYRNVPKSELLNIYQRADILLLMQGQDKLLSGNVAGKLMEYVGTQKPVLAFTYPGGEAAEIIKKHDLGHAVDINQLDKAVDFVRAVRAGRFRAYKAPKIFDRRYIAGQIASLM